jgi:hypothetical protein
MIRNPSDGTTYEPPESETIMQKRKEGRPHKGWKAAAREKFSSEVTGLPEIETEMGNTKSKDEIKRLDKSRDWLKRYGGKSDGEF